MGLQTRISQQAPAGQVRLASSPGMTEMVLRARSTLKVLKADTLPRSTNSVTYLQQAGDRSTRTDTHTGLSTRNVTHGEKSGDGLVGQSEKRSDGRSCSRGLELKSSTHSWDSFPISRGIICIYILVLFKLKLCSALTNRTSLLSQIS